VRLGLTRSHSLRRACDYSLPDPTRPKPEEEITLLRARVDELEKLVERSITGNKAALTLSASGSVTEVNTQIQTSVSSSLFFLDERFFSHIYCSLQPVSAPVPNDIADVLKDEYEQPQGMEQLMSRYFDAVHGWMPIISKMRIKRVLDRSGQTNPADLAFLLCCMKLLLQIPQSGTLPEALPLYRTAKVFNLQLEIAGLQSILVIQGGLLIAVYELGHGIYPACYTTVAQCARQAISIGLHNQESPQNFQQWTDWEEQIRVWWFVVMLDRYVETFRQKEQVTETT
jgi:hypothetical protein